VSSSELLIYIRNEIGVNIPKEKIIEHLILSGYAKADIDRAFADIKHAPNMGRTAVFSDMASFPRRKNHFFGWVLAFLIFNALAFAAFSILFNMV